MTPQEERVSATEEPRATERACICVKPAPHEMRKLRRAQGTGQRLAGAFTIGCPRHDPMMLAARRTEQENQDERRSS